MTPKAFRVSKPTAALALSLLISSQALAETYSYDAIGRLVSVVYDDGSSISYSYDANGNLLQSVATAVVSSTNAAPTVSIAGGNRTIPDSDGAAGELVSFSATATDSDGTIESTQWLVNNALKATGLSASIALSGGNTVVTFRATDDDGATSDDAVTITVTDPPNVLPSRLTLASDGSTTSAQINGGVSSDSGGTFKSDFVVGDAIQILIVLEPESEDIGFSSDVFVIAALGSNFLLVTPDGLSPWDGNVANLVPFDNIELDTRNEFNILDLFGGQFTLSAAELGSYQFFIGYSSRDGAIIYTQEAVPLNVLE